MTVLERQQQLAAKEDLAPYEGKWVALRNGFVVAHDIDALSLRRRPEVEESDVLMPVRRRGPGINVL